jgi:hypothetical protein
VPGRVRQQLESASRQPSSTELSQTTLLSDKLGLDTGNFAGQVFLQRQSSGIFMALFEDGFEGLGQERPLVVLKNFRGSSKCIFMITFDTGVTAKTSQTDTVYRRFSTNDYYLNSETTCTLFEGTVQRDFLPLIFQKWAPPPLPLLGI